MSETALRSTASDSFVNIYFALHRKQEYSPSNRRRVGTAACRWQQRETDKRSTSLGDVYRDLWKRLGAPHRAAAPTGRALLSCLKRKALQLWKMRSADVIKTTTSATSVRDFSRGGGKKKHL